MQSPLFAREKAAPRAAAGERERRELLPVTILTGFLGSGKTTILRRALAAPEFSDTAVLVNELGEIGLDHHLLKTVEGTVIELPQGCLCCALREDLAQAARALIEAREKGEIKPFRRLAIETTGLADPAPILFTLAADPFLDGRLSAAAVVTLLDAVSGALALDRFAEAARQVALADRILVTKTDLAPFSPGLEERIQRLNGFAPRSLSTSETGASALFFEALSRPFAPAFPEPGPGIHSHGIDRFAMILEGPLSRLEFARALGSLAARRGSDLLRVKGLLSFSDRAAGPAFVEAAQHALYPPLWLDDWPDPDRRNRLQFIVHEIAREEVFERFAFARPRLGAGAAFAPRNCPRN